MFARGSAMQTEGFGRKASGRKDAKRLKPAKDLMSTEAMALEMLRYLGVCEEDAEKAVTMYPHSVEHAVRFAFDEQDSVSEEALAPKASVLQSLVAMGFPENAASDVAAKGVQLPEAIELLLAGQRSEADVEAQRKRRMARASDLRSRIQSNPLLPAGCERQYVLRAAQELGGAWEIVDLGLAAGVRVNACLWLCVAAAASRCRRVHEGPLGPWLAASEAAFEVVAQTPVSDLRVKHEGGGRPSARDPVGRLADDLRQTFCSDGGLMLTQTMGSQYWPFYAALQGTQASYQDYTSDFTMSVCFSCFFCVLM